MGKRGVKYRQFIKERLMGHPIWQDGNYWEQTLWQCALEQVNATLLYVFSICCIWPLRSFGLSLEDMLEERLISVYVYVLSGATYSISYAIICGLTLTFSLFFLVANDTLRKSVV